MDDDRLSPLFPTGLDEHGGETQPEAEPLVAPGDIYASVTGQRQALTLRFIWKDKRSLSVPYGYLPILWGLPSGALIIEYPNLFSILLAGKELDELFDRINDHRIVWVREFDEHEANSLASAVTRIEILRVYPSREADQWAVGSGMAVADDGQPSGSGRLDGDDNR